MKVKSNEQVAMNENSDSVQKLFSLGVAGEDSAPNSNYFHTSEIVRKGSS